MVQNTNKAKIVPKPSRLTTAGTTKESFEPIKASAGADDEVSLRVKLENLLTSTLGKIIDRISLLFSLVSFSIHIADTYQDGILADFYWIDISIMIFYVFEYLLYLYSAQHKLMFLLSYASLINISTFAPLTFIFITQNEEAMVAYKISIVLRFIRILRYLIKLLSTGKNEVSRQMYTIFLTVAGLVMVTAGIIQVLEAQIRPTIIQNEM
jgi:voltage-gated potassium channel